MIKKTILCASVSALVLISTSAQANEDQMSMEQIQAQLQQLAEQVQHLSNVVEQQNVTIQKQNAEIAAQKQASVETASAIANIAPAVGEGEARGVKVSMKPSPKIESADGQYSFQPFGRVHLDTTQFDDDKFDHANNSNFRRARLGFKGKLGEDFEYKSEVDFAGENVAFKEVSLTYTGLENADIKIGHQKPSFGMEQNTSSNYLLFTERSAPTNAFTRDEEIGLNVMAGGSHWSLAAGIFNEDAGNSGTGEDEDVTVDVRGSVNALGLANADTKNVLHLGAGYSHRAPTGNVRFSARPGTGDGARQIDTGNIGSADDVGLFGVELAAVVGPFSFQSEYFDAEVSRSGGNQDARFDGYYAQVGWIVTGESRPYKGDTGNFGRIKPQSPFSLKEGGWGAWEVLARYDNTDLNDAAAGITGGEMDTTSLGVNWHLTDYVRLMANVVDVDSDANAATAANDDPTVYNVRAQWDF
tara:strand:- start:26815 stop:28227 length:1413 start_codon:yes stop_codon:yes gene_type:complete